MATYDNLPVYKESYDLHLGGMVAYRTRRLRTKMLGRLAEPLSRHVLPDASFRRVVRRAVGEQPLQSSRRG